MKIKKGKSYLCINDVMMAAGGEIAFTKGTVYVSGNDGYVANNLGDADHNIADNDWNERHFVEYTPLQTPLSEQVGGSHYKDMPIQPIEYTMKNGLNFCQGNIVKYITRYKAKNGVADLNKAKHYIDLLIYFETQNQITK